MEESFVLCYYGNISLAEQRNMTSEERSWYVKKLKEVKEKEAQQESGNTSQQQLPGNLSQR